MSMNIFQRCLATVNKPGMPTREEWLEIAKGALEQAESLDHSQNAADYRRAHGYISNIMENPRFKK